MSKQETNPKENKSACNQHPEYQIDIKLFEKPMRIVFNGKTVANSRRILLLQEQNHAPVYYFPPEDVHMDILQPTTKTTFCPFKGEATHWALSVGAQYIDVAAWSYEDPFDEVKQIKDYIAFYPAAGELISQ